MPSCKVSCWTLELDRYVVCLYELFNRNIWCVMSLPLILVKYLEHFGHKVWDVHEGSRSKVLTTVFECERDRHCL